MKLLMISGSLRQGSYNTAIVDFLENYYKENGKIEPTVYRDLDKIPPFTPDLDLHDLETDQSPREVQILRAAIKQSDVVLIATPEYAFEIPGVLKNALDWIVSSGEMVDKPVLPISSSTSGMGGESAYEVLVKLVRILSGNIVVDTPLKIDRSNKKISETGEIIDEDLKSKLINAVEYLYQTINR